MKTFARTLLITIMLMASCIGMGYADDNTTKHIVDRGETLASIAKRYATTEAKIIELNPEAAQFIYVGMELTIPMATIPANTTPAASAISSGYNQTTSEYIGQFYDSTATQSQSSDPSDNYQSQWGIDYVANFSSDGKGYYGIFAEMITDSGWGGFFSAGASYGIIDPGSILFRIGPDYGLRINESTSWSIPVALNISTVDHTTKATYNENLDKTTTSSDTKVLWGLSATPKIAFNIQKVYLNVGLDLNYTFKKTLKSEYFGTEISQKYGGKAYVGFFIGIGFKY